MVPAATGPQAIDTLTFEQGAGKDPRKVKQPGKSPGRNLLFMVRGW